MQIQEQVLLAPYTTLGVGGPARFFVVVQNQTELREACEYARQHQLPVFVLGGGSNVLIDDWGWPGLVIRVSLEGIDTQPTDNDEVLYTVGAGVSWDEFVKVTCEADWWGIENLSGIPGLVGAAPVQNINAYGVSVADTIEEVVALDRKTGDLKTFSNEACQFAYRDSWFKSAEGAQYIIVAVSFRLTKQQNQQTHYRSSSQSIKRWLEEHNISDPMPSDLRAATLAVRSRIGMLAGQYQSAGSFFKNTIVTAEQFAAIKEIVLSQHQDKHEQFQPWYWEQPDDRVKISTAFLMECTPYNKNAFANQTFNGTVGLSPKHSLSIINVSDATAHDILSFAQTITAAIEKKFNVTIESEVTFVTK